MTIAFIIIAALLTLFASAAIMHPLLTSVGEHGSGRAERHAAMAQNLSELDTERASGALGEAEYDEAKRELQRQALETDAIVQANTRSRGRGRIAALVVGVGVPAAAAALYLGLGQPAALTHDVPLAAATQANAGMSKMIGALSARLRQNPDDAEGWLLLARSYNAVKQSDKALSAYAKASALQPTNANLLVEYANTAVLADNHQFAGKPKQLIDKALVLEPDNLNALALAGAAAMRAGKNDDAVRYWTHLKQALPADSPDLPQADALIARAEGKPAPDPGIHGSVQLAPDIAGRVRPTDTVFIFARATNGSAMPLAVKRLAPGVWPLTFSLNDHDAMTSKSRLSQYQRVNIVARISRTGSARSRPGDFEGEVRDVALGAGNVNISIDHEVDD